MIIRHAQRAGRHLYISHHVRASAYRANASAPCRLNDTVAALPVTEASRYSKSALPKPYCRLLSTEAGDDIVPEDEDPQRYEFFGPQIHERRVDLSDPSISKMSPVQLARRVISLDVGTLHPDDVTHGLVRLIKDCCMLQTEASMEVAKGLLQRLVEEKRYINATLLRELNGDGADNAAEEGWGEPLVIAHLPFHVIMYGWARLSGRGYFKNGPAKAREIIDWMVKEDEYDNQMISDLNALQDIGKDDEVKTPRAGGCQPTAATFNTLLTAYVNSSAQERGAGLRAEQLLDEMLDLHDEKGWHCKPNSRSFGLVLNAHAKSSRFHSAKSALATLSRMKDAHEYERERYEKEVGRPYDVDRPEQNAWRILTPDIICYTTVINAFGKSDGRGYAQEAENILLDVVHNRHRYGIQPDARLFSSTIRAWATAAKKMGNPKARFEAAERAESILRLMAELSQELEDGDSMKGKGGDDIATEETAFPEGKNYLVPTTRTYNACLNAWARSDVREAAPRAQALLDEMLAPILQNDEQANNSVKGYVPPPDRLSFNITIASWARSFEKDAAVRGEALFDRMYELYHSGRLGEEIKPQADTYTSVINAHARSRGRTGQTANARRLLDVMINKYSNGEEDFAPNMMAYTSVLNAAVNEAASDEDIVWAGVDGYDKDNAGLKPFDDDSPYSIAMRTYHEMKVDAHDTGVSPDHIAYATMMKVIASHTSDASTERRSMLETVFADACGAGCVSSAVIKQLRAACPDEKLLELILRSRKLATSDESIFKDLPTRWTRNVGGDLRRRKVRIRDMKRTEAGPTQNRLNNLKANQP